jgi:hypothetical protein
VSEPNSVSWQSPSVSTPGPTISFAFNLGKVPDQGEDSDPIVRQGPDLGLIGVFDGMGGAGGTVYDTPEGPRSGAYLASRIARDVVERRMLELLEPDWNLNGKSTAEELHRSVQQALNDRLTELKRRRAACAHVCCGLYRPPWHSLLSSEPNPVARPGRVTCSGRVTHVRTCSSLLEHVSSPATICAIRVMR